MTENPGDGPGPYSYRVWSFQPGTTKSGALIREVPNMLANLHSRIVGPPDYSLDSKTPNYDNLLSLGNNGAITFEVDGYLIDGPGPDFSVFENPFVVHGTNGTQVYAETAIVSVAIVDEPSQYRVFSCQHTVAPYTGCAGVIPVRYVSGMPLDSIGGDQFDLSTVGLARARYIRIQDTGDNESFLEGTEGLDLDGLALLHTSFY
jgi:hypothetical protein